MSFVPGTAVQAYVGRVSFVLVRETRDVSTRPQEFLRSIVEEVQSLARAQVLALGGNALLSVRIVPRESQGSAAGHVYHLITIAGDAALTRRVG